MECPSSRKNIPGCFSVSPPIRGGTSYEKLGGRNIFAAAPPTVPVCPALTGAHAFFALQLRPCHNESESYRPIIICGHCVDQQRDSLVFTEFQSDVTTRSETIEKWEDKYLFSPPCIEIWRGIRPPCPTACSTPRAGGTDLAYVRTPEVDCGTCARQRKTQV